ncbi:Regulator of chromosome condensation 1/beta-lactamase-inhibitor protein II [Naviculisporaceae sp. PSN 640]
MVAPLVLRNALRQLHPPRLHRVTGIPWVRHASSNTSTRSYRNLILGLVSAGSLAGGAIVGYPLLFPKDGATKVEQAEIVFEEPRKSNERASVSSQQAQLKNSLEHPGVYAWGSNAGKVVAPDSTDAVIKTPRRIPYFDGQVLRDLKLDRNFGVAVTEKGDLVQWGSGFSKTDSTPTVTLKGKNISKVAISRDRIIALSSDGSVYSIPVAAADQTAPGQSYRTLKPKNLGWREKVVDVSSGLDHCLMLTSSGRVFASASSSEEFPSKGQLGIPKLTWSTRPEGPYDQPHEVTALSKSPIKAIATGDFHSLVLDVNGNAFSFGDNSSGQLGLPLDSLKPFIDTPSPLPLDKLSGGPRLLRKVTSIAAGGLNSFFTTEGTQPTSEPGQAVVPLRTAGKVVAETWACGEGIYGSLGTGKWTHSSTAPTKIKALSDLFEYDEKTNSVSPIRLAYITAGSTHACAVMGNSTESPSSRNVSNFGEDALLWGGNEYYQLGTGKRNNLNAPAHIAPLDGVSDADTVGRTGPQRFQVTPKTTVRLGEGSSGRKVSFQQRVECGRHATAVYSAV